jgi:hypothetical protein
MKIVGLGKDIKFYKDTCCKCDSLVAFCEYETENNSYGRQWKCPICKTKNTLYESDKDNVRLQIPNYEYVEIEEDLTLRLMIK